MRKLPIYIIMLLLAVSCVYPFTADIENDIEDRIVINGDIRVGDYAHIDLGYVMKLDGFPESNKYPVAWMVIENTAGQAFASRKTGNTYHFDLRTADPNAEYRLLVTIKETGKNYRTPWLKVHSAPEITDLSTESDDDNVSLLLSLEGTDDSRYFVMDYSETWEYHADFVPDYMYDPYGSSKAPWRERLPEEDYYYCWSSSNSKESVLANSAASTKNSINRFPFRQIHRADNRLQVLYAIDVDVKAVSKDGYVFLQTMNTNSNNTGSLFSPVPSDVRGNIRCEEDTNEVVIGFVDAYIPVQKRFFIDNATTHFYKGVSPTMAQVFYIPQPDEDGTIDYAQEYLFGNSPYGFYALPADNGVEHFYWAPTRCLDCRYGGGTKQKPSYWPNDHK